MLKNIMFLVFFVFIYSFIKKNCKNFKNFKYFGKIIILEGINNLKNKKFKFTFCKNLKICSNNSFLYNINKKECFKEYKTYKNQNLNIQNYKNKLKVIESKNIKIDFIKHQEKEKLYKIEKNVDGGYHIYWPYVTYSNLFFIYLISIWKIIVGIYICFFGIKNFKITILFINSLVVFEIFRLLFIFEFHEQKFYNSYASFLIFCSSIVIGLLMSYLTFKYDNFKLGVNTFYFNLIIIKFIFYLCLVHLIFYFKLKIIYLALGIFIITIILSFYLCKKKVITSILIYTSTIGSSFIFYNWRKILFLNESIAELVKYLIHNQEINIFDKGLILTLISIIICSILGYLCQNKIRKKIFSNLNNSVFSIKLKNPVIETEDK